MDVQHQDLSLTIVKICSVDIIQNDTSIPRCRATTIIILSLSLIHMMYSHIRSLVLTGLLAPLPFVASIPLALVPLETAPDLPYTWDYKGCFIDRVGNRALKRAATSDHEMTGGLCSRWCAEQGYNLAGTEWGREVHAHAEDRRS